MKFFILHTILLVSLLFAKSETIIISPETISDGKILSLAENARYRQGDKKLWAERYYNDSRWRIGDTRIIPDSIDSNVWDGVGWFRFELEIDSTYFGEPLAMHVIQAGACEIYFNGKLVYNIGSPGKNIFEELPRWDQKYPTIIIPSNEKYQTIAVRYSNFSVGAIKEFGYKTGLEINISELEDGVEFRVQNETILTALTILLSVVPVLFAFIHLMMFFFDKSQTGNLFFSIFTFCIGITNFLEFAAFSAEGPVEFISIRLINVYPIIVSVVFMLLFSYDSFKAKIPKHFALFLVLGSGLIVWSFFHFNGTVYYLVYIFALIALLEIVRIIIVAFKNKKVKLNFLIFGFLFFTIALSGQVISKFGLTLPMMVYPLYYLGVAVLILSMSIHLSQNYARISKDLEAEVKLVKELSAQKLAQEREAREREIAQKVLEADNKRKTLELAEARKLQISMLPKYLPDLKHIDIATFIKTATEVGGDYYDFYIDKYNELVLAIGDATGHGMKAGTLVSSTKSLFNALVSDHSPLEMTVKINRSIKNMNLPSLYMALLVAKFNCNSFSFSNSGMPPILHYDAQTNEIATIIQKSMPLGAFAEFKYRETKIDYRQGDILLFSSDGLLELFDKNNEMLGIDGMINFFRDSLDTDINVVKSRLVKQILERSNYESLRDDLTFIIVKINHIPNREEEING